MKIERDERRFDFHDIGLAIKRAREASGMTQEQLAYIVDRAPRTIMYNENDGQHPSLNTFYQMVTMFDISVDQYFYPSKNKGSECRKAYAVLPVLPPLSSKKAITKINEHLPFPSVSGSFSRHFKLHKRNLCSKAICTIHFLISNTEMAI